MSDTKRRPSQLPLSVNANESDYYILNQNGVTRREQRAKLREDVKEYILQNAMQPSGIVILDENSKIPSEVVSGATGQIKYSATGDGMTHTFTLTHSLGFDPSTNGFSIDAISANAQGMIEKSANSSSFTIKYDICPIGAMSWVVTVKQ